MVDVTSAVIVCDAGDGARGNCRRYLRVAAVRWVVGDIKKWWVMVVRGEERQRKKKKKKEKTCLGGEIRPNQGLSDNYITGQPG